MSDQLILKPIEEKISDLLIGLDITNAPDRLKVVMKIKSDIENIENSIKSFIDIRTEMEAFNRTGIKKRYYDSMKEKPK